MCDLDITKTINIYYKRQQIKFEQLNTDDTDCYSQVYTPLGDESELRMNSDPL